MTTVRDIMSFGALTVHPTDTLNNIVDRLRRVGHEGYPVVNAAGDVIGLLTARDMNRAAANHLTHLRVEQVMQAGNITISPDASVRELPQLMTHSEWGQIPVVAHNTLIGIVTRTDVIRFYANAEAQIRTQYLLSHIDVVSVLGNSITKLISTIAKQALQNNQAIYMVGGVVRDLLLQRPNTDVDFVLEGSAIPFAEKLAAEYGGRIETHTAFGTAKWIFDETAANNLDLHLTDIPEYVDLVTARHEFYEEPAVLPTVYQGGIKLDLRRRDFTINALAIQLSGQGAGGEVIDLFGGLDDLDAGVIRALHSLSFSDDPTRTLRAVRFAHRLHFKIEERTQSLIQNALPMMQRITGERLKNELTLLLHEPDPAGGITALQKMGVLRAIHPEFIVDEQINEVFQRADTPLMQQVDNVKLRHWLLMGVCLPIHAIRPIGERLLLRQNSIAALEAASTLVHTAAENLNGTPSEITARLDKMPIEAVITAAAVLPEGITQKNAKTYLDKWRHIRPALDGRALQARGLKPSPQFRVLLDALRAARLDGIVETEAEETAFLDQLLQKERGDHHAG